MGRRGSRAGTSRRGRGAPGEDGVAAGLGDRDEGEEDPEPRAHDAGDHREGVAERRPAQQQRPDAPAGPPALRAVELPARDLADLADLPQRLRGQERLGEKVPLETPPASLGALEAALERCFAAPIAKNARVSGPRVVPFGQPQRRPPKESSSNPLS